MAGVATAENSEKRKRKRTRSPAYPFINLETAIARAKEFYSKELRNAANVRVAMKHWGFVEESSNGAQIVAALISFGLLQDEGVGEKRKVRLTQTALRILLDERSDSKERAELIRQAALAPKIHQQLWEKWGNDLPSDAQLRHTLLLEWPVPFNENAVDTFIREYRDTIAFAKLSEYDIVGPEVNNNGGGDENAAIEELSRASAPSNSPNPPAPATLGERTPPLPKTHMQEFVVPLSNGSRAVFQWPAALSKEDVDDLKDSLKILERKISRSITKATETDQENS